MINKKRRLMKTLLLAGLVSGVYAQNGSFTTASAGNWTGFVAPDSIAAGFGTNFSTTTTSATSLPLGTTLGNSTVNVTDSAGKMAAAPLYFVSPGQINYLIPSNVALGKASVTVTSATSSYSGILEVSNVSPAVFTANNNGSGVAAAQFIRVSSSGQVTTQPAYQVGVLLYVPNPISLLPTTDMVYLILYGTGIRHHSANPVRATINGVSVPVTYAGAQSTLPGLDQINLGPLPQILAGTGKASLSTIVLVDGIPSNTTLIGIQ
jgi:uncharacterized protein (TIGR03437 family)